MSSFNIQQFTRVRDDPFNHNFQNKETVSPGAYQVNNMYPSLATAERIAYEQPIVPERDGFGWSAASIDIDSSLRNHGLQTLSPHCPVRGRTQARPFVTVPYMGRGKGDTNVESRLFMPDFVRQTKDCGTISDATYENQFTPMIPHLAKNIQDSRHLIQEDAAPGWINGGIPSRQWVRDLNC
jgi:hypothetical protein